MENQTTTSPFTQPAEWDTHEACWLAWPSHQELWEENLAPAQEEFTDLCRAIWGGRYPDNGRPVEKLNILVPDRDREEEAKAALRGLPAQFHLVPFGDIWLRDTGPIFVRTPNGKLATAQFQFNGWGAKYALPHDPQVSRAISGLTKFPEVAFPWVLEGGSVDVDGEGTCLTTRQCLLNPNRNPNVAAEVLESELKRALGVSKLLWIQEGLLNDHTDGHIDTIARFIRPGVVMCMAPSGDSDPNAKVLVQIQNELSRFSDAKGRPLSVVTIPSPGRVADEDGKILPASYLNFYISNRSVVVPTYGSEWDGIAVKAIAAHFPDRATVGLSAKAILSGGGAFHCITQQQPLEMKS